MDSIWDPSLIPSDHQPVWLQSQPQLDATVPLDSEQNKARKYTMEDWETQRPEITRLYEENTLNSVMKLMKERHGLDAT